jgi:deoxycytidylate deaminase
MNRPSWNEYFMGLAFAIAQRSEDPHGTKHGCVIVDNHNHIVGTGYNSFMRGVNSQVFPQTRPAKYPWMIHSEINAVSNCTVNLWTIPDGATAYVTGRCCNNCLQHLWQNHVTSVYMAKRYATQLETEKAIQDFDLILRETDMEVHWMDINIDWLKNINVEGSK